MGEEDKTLGLLCTYVDDFLLMAEDGEMTKAFIKHLTSMWRMSTEVQLTKDRSMTFVGLEMQLEEDGTLLVHQKTLTKDLLQKHGMDTRVKSIGTITVPPLETTGKPPTASELRVLQAYAGEFNWLSTRTRADLSYWTSVIASACTKYANWTLALCRKVLRYLVGTVEQGIRLTQAGTESEMLVYSDAGFGGIGTKSQTGCLIAWAGSTTLWRSGRQTTPAFSTCEAEVAAAALSWQIA